MTVIMVDTSVWIDFIYNKETSEVETMARLLRNRQKISSNSIIQMELLQGCKNEREIIRVKTILSGFYCYNIPHKTITQASVIYRACVKGKEKPLTGQTVSPLDCIIASICIENDLPIFSRDVHFDFISKITGTLKIYKSV